MIVIPHRQWVRQPWQTRRRCRTCGHVARNLRDQLDHAYGISKGDQT